MYATHRPNEMIFSQVPTAEDIMKCGIALPNVQSSSDHIMLLCDIQLGGGTGQQAQPPASPIFQGQQQKVGFRYL